MNAIGGALATLAWITDRSPTVDDADVGGRVLVADPMNNRVRAVPLFCASHFPGWFPITGLDPNTNLSPAGSPVGTQEADDR